MLMDALTTLARNYDLTGIGAGAVGYSDTLDLSQVRDIGTADVPVVAVFTTLPTSATGGTTFNLVLQTSPDNATWTNLEETAFQPIANFTATAPWLFRGFLPAGVQRYIRAGMSPSAVLTAGQVTINIGADWPRTKSYPKNYAS